MKLEHGIPPRTSGGGSAARRPRPICVTGFRAAFDGTVTRFAWSLALLERVSRAGGSSVSFEIIPLAGYLSGGGLLLSAAVTRTSFFFIGTLKSRWSPKTAWRLGLETLVADGSAAAPAFLTGHLLGRGTGWATRGE